MSFSVAVDGFADVVSSNSVVLSERIAVVRMLDFSRILQHRTSLAIE